ncbi:Type 1 glutamine amidotransferase-like domain-containing protein [Halobacillus litoralis]|uniref:Type 1 glutamine amidotransferase-like domain-containing protein n=1 Tax=Halobacillus litoralis TaxID=45668 RepID=UPI001CD7E4BC|nr:Type 1 glutamine amidotransferase-like domain-containing protein [Halobacillus litoralis]MCA0971199.1 Type 1 glutamine amidotransferase-like domain-containing protein [Halobacillus litoralis]
MDTHLFMFGSSPPFNENLGAAFYDLMQSSEVAVLYIEREGSEAYLSKYTQALPGEVNMYPLALKDTYHNQELEKLKGCGGIIIGGGDTSAYRHYIVDSALASVIKERFQSGVPVAGFSAGALISPKHCVISDQDNVQGKQLFEKGLGLLDDAVIAAHYLEWQEQRNLKTAVTKLDVSIGYGIAEDSGIYLHNNQLAVSEGYVQFVLNPAKQQ